MELSLSKTNEAKKLKASVAEIVMADLLSLGYSEEDAYTIAYPDDVALSMQLQRSNRKDIVSKTRFKQLCEVRRNKNASYLSAPSNVLDVELVGAEEVAKEILLAAKKQPVGSKERADLFAKYNEIRAKNEQVVEDSTDSINFALPLKCNQCPLLYAYNQMLEEQGDNKIRPVEMERVLRLADKIIREATEEE